MRAGVLLALAALAWGCSSKDGAGGYRTADPRSCPKVGAWVESLSGVSHIGFAAAQLADGRVLVTGGADYGRPAEAATYELDPATRCWAAGVPMSSPRRGHTMVALADGRALVAGGFRGEGAGGELATTEIFDPRARTWVAGPTMSEPGTPSLVVLRDGKVFVVPEHRADAPWAEILDPSSAASAPARVPGSRPLYGGTLTLLADGRVLMVGGSDSETPAGWHAKDATVRTKVELYDPKTGVVSKGAPLGRPREDHTATLLPDGRVLVAGGQTDAPSKPHATTEIYDPVKDTWSEGPPMTMGRYGHAVVRLSDGRYLAFGGYRDTGPFDDYTAVLEVFDLPASTWKRVESTSKWRADMFVFPLPDAGALVVGGNSELNQPVTEILSPP